MNTTAAPRITVRVTFCQDELEAIRDLTEDLAKTSPLHRLIEQKIAVAISKHNAQAGRVSIGMLKPEALFLHKGKRVTFTKTTKERCGHRHWFICTDYHGVVFSLNSYQVTTELTLFETPFLEA